MDPLYKIIKQLSEEEFEDIYQNLTSNKAEKSALFLRTIRESDNPVEDFLEKQDISASAFYVLKSRLNQKVESFLLNRLGDPKMEAVHKAFKVYDLIFDSPREISITTLKRLEKTMQEMDNPMVLMLVYRSLKMLHNDDQEMRSHFEKQYNQAVAFYLATEKGIEGVMSFFRSWDRWYLGRKEKDFNDMCKTIERMINLNNLYQSKRLYVLKSVVTLYAQQFLTLPDRIQEILDDQEECFDRCFRILEENNEDILFKNINLIFDFLRFVYFHNQKEEDREKIYFEILDYKIEELLTKYNFGMDCSPILYFKLNRHLQEGTLDVLQKDYDNYISQIDVETHRIITYVNFTLFQSYVSYYTGNYDNASRMLYRLRNKVNLRKFPHIDAEVKMFLAFTYVIQDEVDLANQLILSLQRQLKKPHFEKYEQGKLFLKILTNRLSGKTTKRVQQVRKYLEEFKAKNEGEYKLLPFLDLEYALFTNSPEK